MRIAHINIYRNNQNNLCKNKCSTNTVQIYRPLNIDTVSFGNKLPENFGEVVPGKLFRGAFPSEENIKSLKDKGVTFIIDLCGVDAREKDFAAKYGIEHIYQDGERFNRFRSLALAIQKKIDTGGVGYIHCTEGKNRTGKLVAYYQRIIQDKNDIEIENDYLDYGGDKGMISTILDFIKNL